MSDVEERIDDLKQSIQEFVRNVGIEFNKVYNSQLQVHNSQLRTEAEMREFKTEMREFKDEMREFKDEMREFKDEMREFKDEMREFKDEMGEFKDATHQANRDMNRRWGELANKMGTLVEDLVAPSLGRIVKDLTGQDVVDLSVRRKRQHNGQSQEFDAIAITADRQIGLNSTKSSLRSADIDHFIDQELPAFRRFFPEYADYPIVGILASLAVEDSVLNYAERRGLVVLGVGDALMEIKNHSGFIPKYWV